MGIITSLTRSWLTRSWKPFIFKNEYDQILPYSDCENLGLYIRVAGGVSEGTQTVTKQDIAGGTQVAYGTVITVETTDMAQQSQ